MKNESKILIGAIAINLCLGLFYSWNTVRNIVDLENVSSFYKTLPYSINILCFGFGMLPAGRLNQKIGRKNSCKISAFTLGIGLIICGLFPNIWGFIIGFGFFIGISIPLGYSSTIPLSKEFFSAEKTGTVTGIITASFGAGAIFSSLLIKFLFEIWRENSFFILGALYAVIMYLAAEQMPESKISKNSIKEKKEISIKKLIKNYKVKLLVLVASTSALPGLIIIGNATSIISDISGVDMKNFSYILTIIISLSSISGRILAGKLNDYLGIKMSSFLFYVSATISLFLLLFIKNLNLITISIIVIGVCYGATSSLNPIYIYENFNNENFSEIFGIMFLGWTFSGVLAPIFAEFIRKTYNSYYPAILLSGILMLISIWCSQKITRKQVKYIVV